MNRKLLSRGIRAFALPFLLSALSASILTLPCDADSAEFVSRLSTPKGWSEIPTPNESRIFAKSLADRSFVVVVTEIAQSSRTSSGSGEEINAAKKRALSQAGLADWTVTSRQNGRGPDGAQALLQQGFYTSTEGKRTLFAEKIVTVHGRTLRLLLTARNPSRSAAKRFTPSELAELELFVPPSAASRTPASKRGGR